MQELEKILEEIEQRIEKAKKIIVEHPSDKMDEIANDTAEAFIEAYKECQDIIRKHIKNEEDILKFYYCESEDDYYLGQRVQNMYYARYEPGGFTWFASRYLPWGKCVTAPETAWKEYTYPTEPKEIPFTEWMKGFIRKHMNDGWIPVSIRMPEKAGTYIINVLDGERDIVTFAKWQNRYKRFDMTGARAYWRIIAWRPIPEPYRPEQPETCKYTGGSCCWPIDQCSDCSNHPERGERE